MPARHQTRRSVSIPGPLYDAIADHAATVNKSPTAIITAALRAAFPEQAAKASVVAAERRERLQAARAPDRSAGHSVAELRQLRTDPGPAWAFKRRGEQRPKAAPVVIREGAPVGSPRVEMGKGRKVPVAKEEIQW